MTDAVRALFDSLGVLPFWVVFEPRALRFPFAGAARIAETEECAMKDAESGCVVVELIAVDEEARRFKGVLEEARKRSSRGIIAWARFMRRWLKNEPPGADDKIWRGEEAAETLKRLGFLRANVTLSPRELMILLEQRIRLTPPRKASARAKEATRR